MNRYPVLLFLSLLLLTPACERGCGCGPVEPDATDAGISPIPPDSAGRRRDFAQHLPLGTHAMLVVDSFAELAESFQAVKERIRNLFDLGSVESEIRNTFGVDLNRRVTFREAGVAYDAGFALAMVHQHLVLAVYLVDPSAFLQRAQGILRRQPFNLRAPIQSEEIGDYHIELYARRTTQPPEMAVVTNGLMAFVVIRTTGGPTVAEVARALAVTTRETSVAANPDFEVQLAHFNDFMSFLFLDAVSASSFYQQQLADQLEPLEAFALSQFNSSVQSIGGAVRLEENRLVFRGYLSVTDAVAQAAAGIDTPRGNAANLARFLSPSSILVLRTGIDPRIVWETVLRFQGERGAELLRRRVRPFEEFLQATFDGDLTQVLTGQSAILINRVSLLSLLQGTRFTDWADALGLVAVLGVADPDRVGQILDRLASADESPYQRLEEEGLVRYACRREEPCFGQILLGQDLLVLSADRVHRWVASRLNQPAAEAAPDLPAAALALLSDHSTTGVFVNFTRLVPLATILNYPQVVRDFLGFLDTLVVEMKSSGNGVLVDGQLVLTATE